MDELARQLATVRDAVQPEWDEARSERLLAGTIALGRHRRRRAVVMSAVGVLSVALMAVGLLARDGTPNANAWPALRPMAALNQAKPAEAAPRAPTVVAMPRLGAGQARRLADGSVVEMVSTQGELEVVRDAALQVELRLRSGMVHCDIVPNTARRFVIDAGPVDVSVLGTVFDVERADDRVRVTVTEGKVRVRGKDGETVLAAGQSRWFGAVVEAPAVEPEPETHAAEAATQHDGDGEVAAAKGHRLARKDAHVQARASWRSLSQAGEYDAAFRSLSQSSSVENDPLVLMDAADAARLSGHPGASVAYLRRVVREHRNSPVAALAAFTLGRVLLESLGQPSEAAESFALARALGPQGSLAQDALAREVEAWSKAGNAQRAYLRARAYVTSYPQGQRLKAVQLYGGLK